MSTDDPTAQIINAIERATTDAISAGRTPMCLPNRLRETEAHLAQILRPELLGCFSKQVRPASQYGWFFQLPRHHGVMSKDAGWTISAHRTHKHTASGKGIASLLSVLFSISRGHAAVLLLTWLTGERLDLQACEEIAAAINGHAARASGGSAK